uniref:Uncharacterized protein n=1 Tax=Romanomermis culicivorax TaxID=13658 RepID=A0A915IM30_ROMCU
MIKNLQSNLDESNSAFQKEVGRLADKISVLEMEKFSEEIRRRRENFKKPIELSISYNDAENYIVKAAQAETDNSVLETKLLEFLEQMKSSNEKIETLSRENEILHLELEE